jgi:hypothetical protein
MNGRNFSSYIAKHSTINSFFVLHGFSPAGGAEQKKIIQKELLKE